MRIDWKIEQIERQPETGGITVAHWRVSATDQNFTAGSYGSADFTPDPESEDFIPFEQLTETNILEWLWAQEDFDKDDIEAGLVTQIEAQKNPPTITGLPWA